MRWTEIEEQHEEQKMRGNSAQQASQLKNQLIVKGLFIALVMVVLSVRAFPPLLEVLIKIFHWAFPFVLVWVIYKFFSNKFNEGFSSSIKRHGG